MSNMASELRDTRLPGESPCVFDNGAGWSSCRTHGWSGPPSQRKRVTVCPDIHLGGRGLFDAAWRLTHAQGSGEYLRAFEDLREAIEANRWVR